VVKAGRGLETISEENSHAKVGYTKPTLRR
jgi:hypothetical protein